MHRELFEAEFAAEYYQKAVDNGRIISPQHEDMIKSTAQYLLKKMSNGNYRDDETQARYDGWLSAIKNMPKILALAEENAAEAQVSTTKPKM